MVATIDGTYAGTKYEKQVFVQPGSNVYLQMIIHFVVVYEAKRTENIREREEKASETEGDE